MRRLVGFLTVSVLVVAWAGSPPVGRAACAGTATLPESARMPRAAIFTGRATAEAPDGGDVTFVVDRWFTGPHAARVVLLQGSSVWLEEPPAAGVIRARLAMTVSGEAIPLVRDQPVLLVAMWAPNPGIFVPQACSLGAVPLDSADGRAALAAAVDLFGAGVRAADLPATDTQAVTETRPGTTPSSPVDWQVSVLLVALLGGLALGWRRRLAAR